MSRLPASMTTLAIALAFTANAHATPITAQQTLQQFNAVVLTDVVSNSHVDGRTYVGGNVSGGDYTQHVSDTPASNYAGLTVRGNAANVRVNGLGAVVQGNFSNATVNAGESVIGGNVNNSNLNGKAYVGGAVSNSNLNDGKASTQDALMQQNANAAGSTDFGSILSGLSNTLALMNSTGSSVSFNGYGKATFNAVANANGVAVFDLRSFDDVLFQSSEFAFNMNGATSVILNSDMANVSIGANFLGGGAQLFGSSMIWNFFNATSITTNAQFGGSILATQALLTNNQNIEGGVFVKELHQNGELHLQPFSGNVDFAVERSCLARQGIEMQFKLAAIMARQHFIHKLAHHMYAKIRRQIANAQFCALPP
ncbi:MAG: choice-of-anchor A family protein, partial [Massilia sp.]